MRTMKGGHTMKKVIRTSTDEYTEIESLDYHHPRRNNGLPGIQNESALARAFDSVGLDQFKIKFYKLSNVSEADIKDTFGGGYFRRRYGWTAWVDNVGSGPSTEYLFVQRTT